MQFNLTNTNEKLFLNNRLIENIIASCRGIINTHITSSDSAWYRVLLDPLKEAYTLAECYSKQISEHNLLINKNILICGQMIASEKDNWFFNQVEDNPISENKKATLKENLEKLKEQVQFVYKLIATNKQYLQDLNKELERIFNQMKKDISRFQESKIELATQIDATNNKILLLIGKIADLRIALVNKEKELREIRNPNLLETIFSFTPVSGIISGVGFISVQQIKAEISEIGNAIDDYCSRLQYN